VSHLPLLLSLLVGAPQAAEDPTLSQVRLFVAAFNDHNVDAMLKLSTGDVAWFSISGSTIGIEARGHDALRTGMTQYFEGLPSARSELLSVSRSGPFVTAVEKAMWTQDGQPRSQCSVSVYEVAEGLIHHVWYYPAHPCTAP
jgi:hypothetical protein